MFTRRRVVWTIAVGLPLVAVALGIRSCACVRRLPGIYLAAGGEGYVEFVRDDNGKYRIGKQDLHPQGTYRVEAVWPRLILAMRFSQDFLGSGVLIPQEESFYQAYKPSRFRRGDWDLCETGHIERRPHNPLPKGWYGRLRGLLRPNRPRLQPHRSPYSIRHPYLHRVDDRRVLQYFDLQRSEKQPAEAFAVARSLLADFPADLHVRMLYLDAAARNDDVDEVAGRLEQWRQDYEATRNGHLRLGFDNLGRWVRARRLSLAGLNAADFCERVFAPDTDFPTRLRLLPEVCQYEHLRVPSFVGIGNMPERKSTLSDWDTGTQVISVIALFRMFEGKRDEALDLLGAIYHMGQIMRRNGSTSGWSFRRWARPGLEILALNCCETEKEFRRLWDLLERWKRMPDEDREVHSLSETTPRRRRVRKWLRSLREQSRVRGTVDDTGFELLRMTTAARYRLVTHGDFPQTVSDFGPLLPAGPPMDPFANGALRFIPTADALFCYSIGPDKRDDRATIEYDPTNGTISGGDILRRVPRRRRYPFPRDGVRAASVEDLFRQFPDGLPVDPFGARQGMPLGAISTANEGVYVFSIGPDGNEPRVEPSVPSHTALCSYDPTNGTHSQGSLFLRIPRPRERATEKTQRPTAREQPDEK